MYSRCTLRSCLFFTALELQPDDPIVHKRRADVLGKLGRREEAVDNYRHAVNIESAKRKIYVKGQVKKQQETEETWETV